MKKKTPELGTPRTHASTSVASSAEGEASGLSPKQADILAYIEAAVARFGRPPTYRDIAKHFNFAAVGTVQDHVRALIRKGFLVKDEGVARGIQLAHRSQSVDIPILGVVPAGRPIDAVQQSLGTLAVPIHLLSRSAANARIGGSSSSATQSSHWGELFALEVTGESMVGAGILPGDFVIVRKQPTARDGEIVVATIEGEATVKRFEKRHGKVRLLPENPRYSPLELSGEEENLIQGKVISVQRYLE
jgi:repressor LexA